jgi:S-adenosylmethionine:tRNA ribosyltransferase-isomerase
MHPWYANLNELPEHVLNPATTTRLGSVLLSEPARRITTELLDGLRRRGMTTTTISLAMSFSWNQATADTVLADYSMNEEEFSVPESAVTAFTKALSAGHRVVSVGTSPARAMETLALPPCASTGRTDLFISPGFRFKYCHDLLTNLHNSMGTHVIMATAFGGREHVLRACEEAVERGYLFGINGDSMLVLGAHEPSFSRSP